MRPTLFVPVWTFFLLGFYKGNLLQEGYSNYQITKPFVLAFILYTLLMGGVYILNQITDIKSDKINKKLYLLPGGYISVKYAYLEMIILFVIAFVLAIPFSRQFKIILLASLALGILYSSQPFKFKARPFIDLLSNSFGYGILAFSLGWVTGNPLSKKTFLFALPYFFAVGAVFINTTIPDIEGDRKANQVTTSIFIGEKKAYLLSTSLLFISLGFSIYLKDWLCGIACLGAMPFFILALLKNDLKNCFLSIRIGAPILVILVGIKFLWFIPLLVVLFFGLKAYYKKRFNIMYPKII